jgi:cysteine synthase A
MSGGKPGWHKIQSIGAGFIPEILNRKVIDSVLMVTNEEAMAASHRLAEQEGILCGISSGAILHASCTLAKQLGSGKRVLAILPDTGERYVTDWFL